MTMLQQTFSWLLATVLLLSIAVGLWLAFPTSRFVTPLDLSYDRERRVIVVTRLVVESSFSSHRVLPALRPGDKPVDQRGYPARIWYEIVVPRPSEPTLECRSNDPAPGFLQIDPSNVIELSLGDWASPCLKDQLPFYVFSYRQIMLWGRIPLIPQETISTVGPPLVDALYLLRER